MAGRIDRRDFLRLSALGAGTAALGTVLPGCTPAEIPRSTWAQGVASGFHSDTEVVLWTRVEPLLAPGVTECRWEVATDPSMTPVVATGVAEVSAVNDHTVKVLVGGLEPGRSYWYRFEAGGQRSPIGRSATLPAPGDTPPRLRLAWGSCQAFATGWYAAWRQVAAQDLDGVVFLGDYIYEAGAIQLLRPLRPEPVAECVRLDDYRAKYRLYKGDPDLQAAHAAHPWAVVWDDHEMVNDWDRTTIALDPARFEAASRAWFEYQPVWATDGTRIHRSLRFGRLAALHMLDTRTYRDPEVPTLFGSAFMTPQLASDRRTLLGPDQRAWLFDEISSARADGVAHQLFGNQVLMGPARLLDLDTPELRAIDPSLPRHAGLYSSVDTWDGFPAERDALLAHLAAESGPTTTVLTGDIHSFWAGSIRSDFDDDRSPVVAHEYAGGSISSPPGGPQVRTGGTVPRWDLVDGTRNGYGVVDCTPEGVSVRFLGHDASFRSATPKVFASFDRSR